MFGYSLGRLLRDQGDFQRAEPLYIEYVEQWSQILGRDHPLTLVSTNDLAFLYQSQGKYDQAELLYTDALAQAKRILGEDTKNI
ncbi:hypothetical protein HK098_003647 [Nowakowskiella sp. JEL0407]|nr:hypothetical protein HK098_003647 [Nowakowskiella sp. JEL0407]